MEVTELKSMLIKHPPRKKWGQNFLINPTLAQQIAQVPSKTKHIIEVGPGAGALTQFLCNHQLSSLQLLEKDPLWASWWQKRATQCNAQVLQCDALEWDWANIPPPHSHVASNLPYSIAASLVIKISLEALNVSSMRLMFQKEVAQRIVAAHSTVHYGMLSVIAQTIWQIDFMLEVGVNEFYPRPKVAGHVLSFTRRHNAEPMQEFLCFLKKAFGFRRKTLYNNLKQHMPCQREHLQMRAQNLSPKQLYALFKKLTAHKHSAEGECPQNPANTEPTISTNLTITTGG